MNILLIGGSGCFINNLIVKLNKEGHRVYLLTGAKYDDRPYQRVFEKYQFGYDSSSLNEIFESIHPDLTIYMGAYDTNFNWRREEEEAVNYSSRTMNILMSYVMAGSGRFVYLSSQEVFGADYADRIIEGTEASPVGYKSMVLSQAEEMCENYRRTCGKDIMILRLDHVFGIPESVEDAGDLCSRMIIEALYHYTITVAADHVFSLLYVSDAVELVYRIATCKEHQHQLYHISSGEEMTEQELAKMIQMDLGYNVEIVPDGMAKHRSILSCERYRAEFGGNFLCEPAKVIRKQVEHMKRYRRVFLYGEEKKKSLTERMLDKVGGVWKVLIPFLENFVSFVICYGLNQWAVNSRYFARLDLYLIYVLLFAVVYGQQQATLAATLSVVGYIAQQMAERSGFDVMVDSTTYVWIAQLFIVGLVVGYMRDNITKLKREQKTEHDYLYMQLQDIKDINDSNVRVKDALETQIINQSDSVGKIYSITAGLDQYSPEEVLFYAAETIAQLMKSEDVAIYSVSNDTYARLFSSTSKKARVLGNSIRYKELGSLYEAIVEHKVFINRKLDENLPVMAGAVYDEQENIQTIILIWSLPWESMTLGTANQLVVISALIHSAVSRANRYLVALEEERYVEGSRMLDEEAFMGLVHAYMGAEKRGLTDCMVLELLYDPQADMKEISDRIAGRLRMHDYVGILESGRLGVLLSNTNRRDAEVVIKRIEEIGLGCNILEDSEE
ncbi:MAG: NAD(P)-dependent oxidoreductase [Lachnospiraceae bacterium]|nr:NAD(P)-dependent oxidoreductase [Lachnospiraceae bacterium]